MNVLHWVCRVAVVGGFFFGPTVLPALIAASAVLTLFAISGIARGLIKDTLRAVAV